MFTRGLFIISIIISSLLHTVSADIYLYTYMQCGKTYGIWHCSASEQCGYTYNSCISGSAKDDKLSTVGGILMVFLWIAFIIGSYVYRIHRRQQARELFTRQIQTLVDQSQQQIIVHVISNPLVAITPSIQEEPPPTYEQVTETRQSGQN